MLFAAVNQQQIRHPGEFFVPLQIPLEPPGEHLLHGRVVVGTGQVLDFEPAVIPLQGPSILIDHHRRNHIVRPGVGDVVGLNTPGRMLHAQHPPQSLQKLILPLLPGGGPQDLFLGVLVGQLDQVHLGAPLGGQQLHPAAHLLRQHPHDRHLVVQLAGQTHLLGQAGAADIILLHQRGHDILLPRLH